MRQGRDDESEQARGRRHQVPDGPHGAADRHGEDARDGAADRHGVDARDGAVDRDDADARDDAVDRDDAGAGEETGRPAAVRERDWFSRLILWLAAVVLGLTLLAIAAAYLPGWWARRVADVVAANQTAGVLAGLACGVVFSALPLLVLRSAVRPQHRWPARLTRLLDAALLMLPNLLTLGVVARGGQDGVSARAVLDVRAPGFAWGTLVGVVVGVVLVVSSWVLLAGRRRRLHELADLRTKLELRDTRAEREPRAEREARAEREPRQGESPRDS